MSDLFVPSTPVLRASLVACALVAFAFLYIAAPQANASRAEPRHLGRRGDPERQRHRRDPQKHEGGKSRHAGGGHRTTASKDVHFWQHATFDPWATAHEGSEQSAEYLGFNTAEATWLDHEHWFERRNITQRLVQLFPLIDIDKDGLVDVHELERWHHINKVFVEKARANKSLVLHDKDKDGLVSLPEWLADTNSDIGSITERNNHHRSSLEDFDHALDDLFEWEEDHGTLGDGLHPEDLHIPADAERRHAWHDYNDVHHEIERVRKSAGKDYPSLGRHSDNAMHASGGKAYDDMEEAAVGEDVGLRDADLRFGGASDGELDQEVSEDYYFDVIPPGLTRAEEEEEYDDEDYLEGYDDYDGHWLEVSRHSRLKPMMYTSGRDEARNHHFTALFLAADVNNDMRLDAIELRHLLNPHLSNNSNLQAAALNMTISNQLWHVKDRKVDHALSGTITEGEWLHYLQWLLPVPEHHGTTEGGHAEMHDPMLTGVDTHMERAKRTFNRLDTNQDNVLQLEEMKPIFPLLYPDNIKYANWMARDQLKRSDTNGDGKLSLAEMVEHVHRFYDVLNPDPHQVLRLRTRDHDELRRSV